MTILVLLVLAALVAFVCLAAGIGWYLARQRARMRGGAADTRRADDGGDPPYDDIASLMG